MRRVTFGDAGWLRAGIGSSDVAALMGCAAGSDDGPLVQWAKVIQNRELKEWKSMRKERLEQGSPHWLDWRGKGVGGSEIGCVVGANPYTGSKAMDVWRRKLPNDHPDWRPEQATNEAMQYGKNNEPAARAAYEHLMGWSAKDVCVIHDDFEWARCSLDGLSQDGRIVVEIKCHKSERKHQQNLEMAKIADPLERQIAYAEVHPSYRYQILWQLEITKAEVAHFVSYKPEWEPANDRFCMFTMYPEPVEQQRLMERAAEFWSFVTERQAPTKEWCRPCHRLPESLKIPENGGITA